MRRHLPYDLAVYGAAAVKLSPRGRRFCSHFNRVRLNSVEFSRFAGVHGVEESIAVDVTWLRQE